jgi:GDPmannose 4,6-dehydratase
LGNLDAKRDWGHARDYVEAMWKMNQSDPVDVVIGTGESRTVGEFAEAVCKRLGLNFGDVVKVGEWEKRDGEVPVLTADPRRAERVLGWKAITSFEELVDDMVKEAVLA